MSVQGDFEVQGRTVVDTDYGFGIIEGVNAQFGIVKIRLIEKGSNHALSAVTVSLPWNKLRVLPDLQPSDSVFAAAGSKVKRELEHADDERLARAPPRDQ